MPSVPPPLRAAEREQLAKIIRAELFGLLVKAAPPMLDLVLADAILAAGYAKPSERLYTREEVDDRVQKITETLQHRVRSAEARADAILKAAVDVEAAKSPAPIIHAKPSLPPDGSEAEKR